MHNLLVSRELMQQGEDYMTLKGDTLHMFVVAFVNMISVLSAL